MAQIEGIDVSYAQGSIDWSQVAGEKDFAIIRAGYGQNNIDATADFNIQNAVDNGLMVGLYWFSYAYTAQMAYDEGLYCGAKASEFQGISLPLFWDFESDSENYAQQHGVTVDTALYHAMAEEFCRGVEEFGYTSGLYYNPSYDRRFNIDSFFLNYPTRWRWVAWWSHQPDKYNIWQYSASGSVSGISGAVDLDILGGSPGPVPSSGRKTPLWMYLKLP